MGLTDATGVLSRYFVVGFFLPAYIALVSLWLTATSVFLPPVLDRHSEGTELVILGGVALVVGLVLSGLNYPLIRVAEGYSVLKLKAIPLLRLIPTTALNLQQRSFDNLGDKAKDRSRPQTERATALWRLDQYFPKKRSQLLPTRIGNAMRAYETHSNVRWGLDGVTIWPRIESLLSSEEHELHVEAKLEFSFMINAAVGALAVGISLIADKVVNEPDAPAFLYAIPFVVAYFLYRAAIRPAVRRGSVVRASIDLHRLEMYEKLGIRSPRSFSDERTTATRINQMLLYGRPPLDDDLWRDAEGGSAKDFGKEKSGGLLGRLFG